MLIGYARVGDRIIVSLYDDSDKVFYQNPKITEKYCLTEKWEFPFETEMEKKRVILYYVQKFGFFPTTEPAIINCDNTGNANNN